MSEINWLYMSDCFGVLVFAVSGALAAGRRSMDIFGVLVIAFITALGGGTLRDLVLGIHPVSWIGNPAYLLLVTIAVVLTLMGQRITHRFDQRIMVVSDAFGLAVFTVIGVQVALHQTVSAPVAIMMGVVTGTAGGAIRDIICNDIPLILKREIYATASALGGIVYCILDTLQFAIVANTLISMSCVLVLRLWAVKAQWALPSFVLEK
ncbi:trimeric intracellular cation channel family protein [Cellvibrio sp. KY-GH-1]|uniref:trimeric intracellular cation channel family protein n=1 Tax=Cellvibrio sp. KY-GH-1 TaxID=2303332 RepID=UPI001245A2D8|nr:trimeric intracellular cation channel family protein [Cellvibrio sp. KY-GH-1]QEY15274.1 trimeric intracellular cation channel family protein [Cellvibrio sp. KY-GH-1]